MLRFSFCNTCLLIHYFEHFEQEKHEIVPPYLCAKHIDFILNLPLCYSFNARICHWCPFVEQQNITLFFFHSKCTQNRKFYIIVKSIIFSLKWLKSQKVKLTIGKMNTEKSYGKILYIVSLLIKVDSTIQIKEIVVANQMLNICVINMHSYTNIRNTM